jgi:23S rRNA pseudouridine1911/1915/1917 synthase
MEQNKEVNELDQNQEGLYEHFRYEAHAGQEPLRVDKFLMNFVENATRNKIQLAAKAGNVWVNDIPVKSNYKVKPKDIVRVVLAHPPHENLLVAEDIPLDIVYEDDVLMVVNKPAGMVVHPGHGNYQGTLVNALIHHVENLPNNSNERPGLVHRIDKDTSGLLLVAKTEFAMAHLAKQFFEKTTDRLYYALVWGNVEEEKGTVEGHIGRHIKNRLQMSVFPEGELGKPAVTHYEVIERFTYVTLVKCKLETGRTHQIRAHMKFIGHTLFNDARYGGDQVLKGTTFTK